MNKIDKYFSFVVSALLIMAAFFAAFFYFKYGVITKSTTSKESLNFSDQAVSQLKKDQPKDQYVVFGVVGDIMLSRQVADQMKKHNNPLLPFIGMGEWLKSNDFNFANLESLFTGSNFIPPVNSLLFNAWPDSLLGLVENNFKVLSLANNHALDYGLKAIKHSRSLLLNQGLQVTGVGQDSAEAWQPAILENKGIKIGFLAVSYSSFNDNGVASSPYIARWDDWKKLSASIDNLRQQVDLIVVSMHGGVEYTDKASLSQIKFAHTAIDQGADLVIGHHPHWVQPREIYKKKMIYYSLGNFIFDQMWSQPTKQGLVVRITAQKKEEPNGQVKFAFVKFEEYPILIEDYAIPKLNGAVEIINMPVN
ncbi:CapA family protein [Patescibacteria group bacterium]|nr:CapA family protein [Patescibacteria group bacterium]